MATAAQTFSDQDVLGYLQKADSPGMIAGAMAQYGVGLDQIKRASGWNDDQIKSYVDSSGNDYLKNAYSQWRPPVAAPVAAPPSAKEPTLAITPPTSAPPPAGTPAVAGAPSPAGTPAASPAPAPASTNPTDVLGIINTMMANFKNATPLPPPPPPAPTVAAQAPAAVQATKDPRKTTQGIVAALLQDPNNPILQRAKAISDDEMNARGLLPSSLGAQAALSAMTDAATKIASDDSNQDTNLIASNAQQSNTVNTANADRWYNADATNAKLSNDRAMQQYQVGADRSNAILNASANMGSAALNNMFAKDQMQLGSQLKKDEMGFGQYLDEKTMKFKEGVDLNAMAVANGYDLNKMDRNQLYTALNMDTQQRNALEQMAKGYGYDISKMNNSQLLTLAQMDHANVLDLGKLDKAFTQNTALAAQQFGYTKELTALNNVTNKSNAFFQNASGELNRLGEDIGKILADPNIEASAKQTLIDNRRSTAISSVKALAKVWGADNSSFDLNGFLAAMQP